MRTTLLSFLLLLFFLDTFSQTLSPAGSATYCVGGAVTLTVNGAAANSTFQWRKDGSNVGIDANTYSANVNGNYTVIITPGSNNTPDTLGPVIVSSTPKPVVDFTFTPNNACSGTNVVFISNISSGTPGYTYAWDFDDAGSSANANPVHAFTSLGCGTGTFNVKFTVTDSKGCTNTVTKQVSVKQKPDVQVKDQNIFSPFNNCSNSPSLANPTYTLTVDNISPDTGCITSYNINWGDGLTVNGVSFPLTHTYTTLGAFNLTVTAIGANGCNNSKIYVVANQSNPAGSLGTLGSTTNLCASANVPFTVSNWTLNSPGTSYILSFGDGASVTLSHPLNPGLTDDTINHLYTVSSCPAGSYTATLLVVNACDQTPYTAGNIQIRIKPTADFTITTSPVCVGTQVCFNNNTTAGSYGPTCSTIATYLWDFGDNTTSTLENPCHTYAMARVYNITLSSTNPCGTTVKTKPVCVTVPPVPGFKLDTISGCTPFVVNVTDTTNTFNSCQNPTYSWVVTYTPAFCGTSSAFTYINGTSDTSANPTFSFTNSGTYTLTQNVTNACGTFTASKTVDVKKPPTVSINLPTYSCGVVTISPAATIVACGTNTPTYAWTFTGGTPATAATANPGSITFTTVGTHPISLSVTNECGTTTAPDSVVVTTAPDVIVPADQSLCGGLTAGPFNFSSNIGTPNYNWTNNNPSIGLPASGTGNIAAFTTINGSIAPVVATIIVTPSVSNCVGIPDTFFITVNPRPTAPLVTTPVTYCQSEPAATLTATGTGANALTWYNNALLTGGTAAAPTPVTATPGGFLFYVTQTNFFNCLSNPSVITINVNPVISGNTIASNQNICANTSPNPLSSGAVSGGNGSYIYQWQSSVNGGTAWSNISGANNDTYAPGILNDTIQYRRIVTSTPCADTSNIVKINVSGALNNFNINANQIICEGFIPAILNGDLPTGSGGGYNYVWEKSVDGSTWSTVGGNTQNYQPAALIITTFYRRIVNAAQCSATSNVVTVTVNPTPVASIVAADDSVCVYGNGIVTFTATVGTIPFNIELVVTRPNNTTDTIRQTINNNGPVNIIVIPTISLPGNYNIRFTKLTDNKGCERTNILPAVIITVKPLPALVLTNSSPICNGVSATLTANGADTYSWSPNTFINTTSGNTVSVTPPSTTTYFVRGILNGCLKDTSILVTVIHGAVAANAGPDQVLCNANTATLAGNAASANASGAWSQVSGPAAIITSVAQNNTTITGLAARGSYIFQWKITGQAPCPPTVDSVTIDVLSPITNVIKNDTIICNGQSLTIRNESLLGGSSAAIDSLYTYQWELTPSGQNNWQIIAGADSATLFVSPAASTCYRRKVKTNNLCETISNSVCVTVNPTIANNIISANQQLCVNTPVNNLQGSTATGGDNIYVYQWQTSTDSIVWNNITNTISYQPPTYAAAGIHYFRRNLFSGNCTAVSNVVTVMVRPDSKAIFASNPTTACAAFDLSTAINVTALPDSNGTYKWYADGILFGSNSTGIFPGYTIQNPSDTVIVKLVTGSQFGCKPDSIEQQFITVRTAVAKFTKDITGGCGPLNVNFTNTSNIINNSIEFFWNFGNGISSQLAQPGAITFIQSPFFNDTTYQVLLKAYNGCDTTVWRDNIKIRSNPKARFGVVTTFGCSPFTVQINNTSLGVPNTYYWDFGNGHKDTTFTTGLLNYTYNIGNAVDTFPLRLIAVNECGSDTQVIDLRIAPNIIRPQININGSELFGCAPHIVSFNNGTSGATSYTWNFDDGTAAIITNNSEPTVVHTFDNPGIFNVSVFITNGCSDTSVTRQVTVFAKPIAAFTSNAPVYCLGDTIRVNNNSQNASNYRWFWGDGQSSSEFNPTHVYTVAGNYTILLRAEKTNNNGIVCFDTLVQSITVLVRPDTRIQSNINNINCAPFTVNATAPGIINEAVTWYITDTTVSPSVIVTTGVSTQYTFNKPGTFSIKILAQNALSCKDSTILTFTVRGTPAAAFTPSNIIVCKIDTTVSYLNTTTFNDNGPLGYRWLVDGVQQSTNGNFTFQYATPVNTILPRIFATQLIASNTVGCSDTATGTLQMVPAAKAQFSINNPTACVPFVLSVANASQYTTKYKWLLNGVLADTAATPVITITQALTPYTITLIADNIYGCKPDTFSVNFTSRIKPTAVFKLNNVLGCSGVLNVVTTNQSSHANSYQWDWGDNSAGSVFNSPTHLYSTPGQYLITLVASDGVCNDTTNKLVTVATKPRVDFNVSDSVTCDTARIQFVNLTTGADSYRWSFSDGTTSTDAEPLKNFAPGAAAYSVKLVAYNQSGCSDSTIKANIITSIPPPIADFFISPSPQITVPDYTFSFNNLALNNIKYTYQWNLGDGSFAATRDIIDHKYADTGHYPVRLVVLDNNTGCPDTIIKMAVIGGYPGYLYVPNAFYPNSVRNEFRIFKPVGKGLQDYRLQVFDGWGKLLFETTELDAGGSPVAGWDGTFKGQPMQQDAYAWRIVAHFRSGKEWDGMSYGYRVDGQKGITFGTFTLFR